MCVQNRGKYSFSREFSSHSLSRVGMYMFYFFVLDFFFLSILPSHNPNSSSTFRPRTILTFKCRSHKHIHTSTSPSQSTKWKWVFRLQRWTMKTRHSFTWRCQMKIYINENKCLWLGVHACDDNDSTAH